MTPRRLGFLFAAYALVLALVCAAVVAAFHLTPRPSANDVRIVSLWRQGERSARSVTRGDARAVLASGCDASSGCTRVVERIVDDGPLLQSNALLLSLSLAAGRDGIAAELGAHTAYLTPTDLLWRMVSEDGADLGPIQLRIGVRNPLALVDELAHELGSDAATLRAHGRLRRFIVQREDPSAALWPRHDRDAAHVSGYQLRQAILQAGHFLSRNQAPSGRFAYEIDSTHDRDLPGYSWPRHGGATLFLAQAAEFTGDVELRDAAIRAARYMQREQTVRCGKHRCIGDSPRVDVGSAALAMLAYQALLATSPSRALRDDLVDLAAFLRSQQRPDGELMHDFDRNTGKPIDVQYPYYTGEVAFALARASRLTKNPDDLASARAALAYLVRRRWSIAQNRYFFGTEHWTCQALLELWDRAPDPNALAFCLDYQGYNRFLQTHAGLLGDYDGGFGQSPFFPPRLTPAGSRTEGAIATLETAIAAHVGDSEIHTLEQQIRRALAFMMRFQFAPGPIALLRNPARAFGALPGGPTDLKLRIDFPQHAGGAMLRYARLLQARAAAPTP